MTQNEYKVEGRSFRTEGDYKRALRDKETIDKLRSRSADFTKTELEELLEDIRKGKYHFFTLLGQDFEDELTDRMKQTSQGKRGKTAKKADGTRDTKVSDEIVLQELHQQEKTRKRLVLVCGILAMACLGYFGFYMFYNQRTSMDYDALLALKEKEPVTKDNGAAFEEKFEIHYAEETDKIEPIVLDEYKNLLNKNKKLIGWVKIDDTNIDYPVVQTSDNEYYLDHNLNQEYDRNGSIFMDKDCNVLKPSTNFILYGHHMKSGRMFGGLSKYSDPQYYQTHRYIDFDTIYEKGIYEVMYVFRSRVYSEEEVVFKYYQFIDAMSEVEFDSNMKEMAAVSLYDTGVTAQYGDRLLTLSTCDYQEKDGRFVVVAKKVSEKE